MRSLRSNVTKASKITSYTAVFDLNSAKKNQSEINPNIFKKQNCRKWRSIAIFGNFVKAMIWQNGCKMVDFGTNI